jgi:hypothetical protein
MHVSHLLFITRGKGAFLFISGSLHYWKLVCIFNELWLNRRFPELKIGRCTAVVFLQ